MKNKLHEITQRKQSKRTLDPSEPCLGRSGGRGGPSCQAEVMLMMIIIIIIIIVIIVILVILIININNDYNTNNCNNNASTASGRGQDTRSRRRSAAILHSQFSWQVVADLLANCGKMCALKTKHCKMYRGFVALLRTPRLSRTRPEAGEKGVFSSADAGMNIP